MYYYYYYFTITQSFTFQLKLKYHSIKKGLLLASWISLFLFHTFFSSVLSFYLLVLLS